VYRIADEFLFPMLSEVCCFILNEPSKLQLYVVSTVKAVGGNS